MNDYIKREDAQNIIDEVLSDYLTDSERATLEDINAEIGELPPADVEPVIRCKNCKFYSDGECTYWAADPYEYNPVEPFDYCSKGEKDNA